MQSATIQETSLISVRENPEHYEDRSQIDPHPEVGTLVNKTPHSVNSDPELVLRNNLHFIQD